MDVSELVITHHPQRHCFEAVVEGLSCVCVYSLQDHTLVTTSTRVPESLGGRGIAAALVEATLTWARDHGYRVRPDCSYVHRYMAQRPATHDLLADGYRL